MYKLLTTVFCCLIFTPFLVTANITGTAAKNLPIKRVVLYSNGVAYIERRGIVSGNTEVDLSFKQSQIDDVLKSMIVLDLGKGQIGAVSYNSSAPASARMAEIPFSVLPRSDGSSGNGGIGGVLAQLQGANVSVTSKGATFRGAILTVERTEIDSEKNPRVINTLIIATPGGMIKSFDLAQISGVSLLDSDSKKDMNEFTGAAASSRRRDAKTITVTSEGSGSRELMVSYIVASPIWKTTYRVVMDKEGNPFFQGWAIVDNVSDENWNDVSLSLVSGSPISFIQKLQRPYYKYRPVVPLPTDVNVAPQVYDQELLKSGNKLKQEKGFVAGARSDQNNFVLDGVTNNDMVVSDSKNRSNFSALPGLEATTAITEGRSGVTAAATGGEIGDLFEYKISTPMTVNKNRSALIPILQAKMQGERISVYNESVSNSRPLSGLKLVNTSGLTLESGSLTVIDGDSYAGEALIRRLKPKEQRLISFAVDLGTRVSTRTDSNSRPARLIKAFSGVFQVHYFRAQTKKFVVSNQTDKPKIVYIEHPIRNKWKLSEKGAKPEYSTERYHRFRIELGSLETKEIFVEEHQPRVESYQIQSISQKQLSVFLSRGYIDADTKKKLERLIDLRLELDGVKSRNTLLNTEIKEIAADQKRLRENITALAKTPEAKQLIARYIQKADAQESRIEAISREKQEYTAKEAALTQKLRDEIRAFTLETSLE